MKKKKNIYIYPFFCPIVYFALFFYLTLKFIKGEINDNMCWTFQFHWFSDNVNMTQFITKLVCS